VTRDWRMGDGARPGLGDFAISFRAALLALGGTSMFDADMEQA